MKKLGLFFPILFSMSNFCFAADVLPNIKFDGLVKTLIPIHRGLQASMNPEILANGGKQIMLERFILSPSAKANLIERLQAPVQNATRSDLPSKTNLGMNNVPVLDQGAHGTCVTFAETAALDAVIAKGDYISQLCNLELGSFLEEKDPTYYSGWDGAFGTEVLAQIKKYGYITKAYQRHDGCSGVFEYPTYQEKNTGRPMSSDSFMQHSEKLDKVASYKVLLDSADVFTSRAPKPSVLMNNVKAALNSKHRVSVGMLLDEKYNGVGAVGSYKKTYDTWVLTKGIETHFRQGLVQAGHELVIIGYDDEVTITDPAKNEHKGIFILRNSWGTDAGNGGEYYMTYDYMQKLATELIEIIPA